MQQIKIFVDIESNREALESNVNSWLKESGAKVVNIFGNLAPQTATTESKLKSIGDRSFASSDILIIVVYEG